MTKRKSISKKIRFEVFKRDSFTCQYCGKSAPDVILEVDHIEAVANGGTNDMFNLITACRDCNRGKSKNKLSSSQTLDKEKRELELLQERKNQIEMMYEWRKELLGLEFEESKKLIDLVNIATGANISLTDSGIKKLTKLIKKYSFEEVLESAIASFENYDAYEVAFNKIEAVIKSKKEQKEKPYMKDVYYIRAILKNRFYVSNKQLWVVKDMIEKAIILNCDIGSLKKFTAKCGSFSDWKEEVQRYIEEHL